MRYFENGLDSRCTPFVLKFVYNGCVFLDLQVAQPQGHSVGLCSVCRGRLSRTRCVRCGHGLCFECCFHYLDIPGYMGWACAPCFEEVQ